MRSRRRFYEVYSLSAIDLFASAMGAFIIISIILMPDYQKEVRSLGDLEYLEALAGQTQAMLDRTRAGRERRASPRSPPNCRPSRPKTRPGSTNRPRHRRRPR
ncbi:MAG: hypothetical protein P8Y52_13990 [Xanthomonadales bacterium]